MNQPFHICAAILLLSTLIGCDDRKSGSAVSEAGARRGALGPPVKVDHPGMVAGRVTFAGPAMRLPPVAVGGDAYCMKKHPNGMPDETVEIGAPDGLANVFVYLKGVPASSGAARAPVLLDQVACQYLPHALALQIDQPLRVRSSDPVLHNVHIVGDRNPAMNLAMLKPGEQIVHFTQSDFLRLRCDVHPWMKAVIGVFDHPYFAVTSRDGAFQIGGIPAGHYTLCAWHERFGELDQPVTIARDGRTSTTFVYKQ